MPTDRRIHDIAPKSRRRNASSQRKIYSRSRGVGAGTSRTNAGARAYSPLHSSVTRPVFQDISPQPSRLPPQPSLQSPHKQSHPGQQRRSLQTSHANSTSAVRAATSPNQGYVYVSEAKWWRRLINNKWSVALGAFMLVSFIGFQALSVGGGDVDTAKVLSSRADDSSQLAFGQTPGEEIYSGTEMETYQVLSSNPRVLRIPQLGVEHRIVEVGVNDLNILAPPANVHDIGWYTGSQAPGAPGAVLLNGYTRGPSLPGPLVQLETLLPGNIMSIETGDGSTINYEIVEIKDYPYDEIDMVAALLPIEPGRNGLNIMTYENESTEFNSNTARRLVLFASEL